MYSNIGVNLLCFILLNYFLHAMNSPFFVFTQVDIFIIYIYSYILYIFCVILDFI